MTPLSWMLAAALAGPAPTPPPAPDPPSPPTEPVPPQPPAPPRGRVPTREVPADAGVLVSVDLDVDLVVRGWNQPRVRADADLPVGWSVGVQRFDERIEVRLEGHAAPPPAGVVLVQMPAEADLVVSTRRGDVLVHALKGSAVIATVAGDVEVDGSPSQVEVSTTAGDVVVGAVSQRLLATSISGSVEAKGARGEVHVESVSGPVRLRAVELERLAVTTVSGDVLVDGALRKGPHEVDVHEGTVTVRVPADGPLSIRARTFSGAILDRFVDPAVRAIGRHERELAGGGPTLRVETFAGDIDLGPRPTTAKKPATD